MTEKPVFIPATAGAALVYTKRVGFEPLSGRAVSRKRESVDLLHTAARDLLGIDGILGVSRKSREEIGMALSAFNLTFADFNREIPVSVECAYQSSKVFERGGPFTDILGMSSYDAKTDKRLRSSGRLTGFQFFGVDWGLEPKTALYDWIYINALKRKPGLVERVLRYSAFTDIEFNPDRSFNCQAYSVALFISLQKRGLLDDAISSKEAFLRVVREAAAGDAR